MLASRQKVVFTKFEGCRCAGKRLVAFLIFHTIDHNFSPETFRQMVTKLKAQLATVQLQPFNLTNTIFSPVTLLHK